MSRPNERMTLCGPRVQVCADGNLKSALGNDTAAALVAL
jgi:hypothetical protein